MPLDYLDIDQPPPPIKNTRDSPDCTKTLKVREITEDRGKEAITELPEKSNTDVLLGYMDHRGSALFGGTLPEKLYKNLHDVVES